jgi:hypothetical protein
MAESEWNPSKVLEELRKHSNNLYKGLNEEWGRVVSILNRGNLGEKGEQIELVKNMGNLKNQYNMYFNNFFKPMTQNEDQFFRTLAGPNFEGYLNMKTISEMKHVISKIMEIDKNIRKKIDMKSFALTNDTCLSLNTIHNLIIFLERLSTNLPSVIKQIDERKDRIVQIFGVMIGIFEEFKKKYSRYTDDWSEDITVLCSFTSYMSTGKYNLIKIKKDFIMCQNMIIKLETNFTDQKKKLTGSRGQKDYAFYACSDIKKCFDDVKQLFKEIVDLKI